MKTINFNYYILRIFITFISFSLSYYIYSIEKKEPIPKKITVCTSASYNPIVYMTSSGEIVGLEPELLSEFSKIYNTKIEYVIMKFDGLLPSLLTKKCDVLATAMMMTESRNKIVDFSLPLYQGKTFFVYFDKSTDINEYDKPDFRIGILQATAQDDYIKKYPETFKFSQIVHYEHESDIVTALRTKKINATLLGGQFFYTLQKKFPNEFFGVNFNDKNGIQIASPVGMVFRKDLKILSQSFNKYLNDLFISGKYEQLLKKYDIQM